MRAVSAAVDGRPGVDGASIAQGPGLWGGGRRPEFRPCVGVRHPKAPFDVLYFSLLTRLPEPDMRHRLPRLIALTLALTATLAASAPTRAAPTARLVQTLDTAMRREAPNFLSRPMHTVDGGALLYYGKGLWTEQSAFQLLEVATLKPLRIVAPLDAFLASQPRRFPLDGKPAFKTHKAEELLRYDRKTGQAVFVLQSRIARGQSWRRALLWDVAKGQITGAVDLAEETAEMDWLGVRRAGELPGGALVLLKTWRDKRPKGTPGAEHAAVMLLEGDKLRTIAELSLGQVCHGRSALDVARGRLLVFEYARKPLEGPMPKGHLVDLKTGAVVRFDIPPTSYAAHFTPDGQQILIYGSQDGVIRVVDAATGRKRREVKVGGLGHVLAPVGDRTLVLMRHGGFQFLDAGKLRKTGQVDAVKLLGGPGRPEGAVVVGTRAFVPWAQDKLSVLELR